MKTVLAVDGGNSKTDIALVGLDGTVLATARGPGFRPQYTGVASAIDMLESLLGARWRKPYADHVAAYVAGADLPVEEARLREEFMARGFAHSVEVGNDTLALLRVGATQGWGVAVVCGAGINCVGLGPSGTLVRFPSLGRLSGDWGGGHDLGWDVLWHAVRAEDGRGPSTGLADAVRACFGVDAVAEVSAGIHFGEIPDERLHELVPHLFAVAARGDGVARDLVDRLASEIAALGTVALRRLGLLDVHAEVVLGGGVLTSRDPRLMAAIERLYERDAPHARLVVADMAPIVGAALLGLDYMSAPHSAFERLRREWAR